MKRLMLLFSFICISLYTQAQQQDETVKKDSIANWKRDSARIANTSPMKLQNQNTQKTNLNVPANKQQRSQYTYDKDGRIIGGSTTITSGKGKGKKKKKN